MTTTHAPKDPWEIPPSNVVDRFPENCGCKICTDAQSQVRLMIVDMIEAQTGGDLGGALNLLDLLQSHNKDLAWDLVVIAGALADMQGANFYERLAGARAFLKGDNSHLIGYEPPEAGSDPWATPPGTRPAGYRETGDGLPGRPAHITEVLDLVTVEELHAELVAAFNDGYGGNYDAVLEELARRRNRDKTEDN